MAKAPKNNSNSLFADLDIFDDTSSEVESLFAEPKAEKEVKLSSAAQSVVRQAQADNARVRQQAAQNAQRAAQQAQAGASQAARQQAQILQNAQAQEAAREKARIAQEKALAEQAQAQAEAYEESMREQAAYEKAKAAAEKKAREELEERVKKDPSSFYTNEIKSLINGTDANFENMGTKQQAYETAVRLENMKKSLVSVIPDAKLRDQVIRNAKASALTVLGDKYEAADDQDFSDLWTATKKTFQSFDTSADARTVDKYATAKAALADPQSFSTGEAKKKADDATDYILSQMRKVYDNGVPTKAQLEAGDPVAVDFVSRFVDHNLPLYEQDLRESMDKAAEINAEFSPQILDEQKNVAYQTQKFLEENPDASGWDKFVASGGIAMDNWYSFVVESAPATAISVGAATVAAIASTALITTSGGMLTPAVAAGLTTGAGMLGSALPVGAFMSNEISGAARDALYNAPVEDLRKIEGWDKLVEYSGGDEEVARLRLTASASTEDATKNFVIGAALGLFGPEAMAGMTASRIISKVGSQSVARTIGTTAGKTLVGMGGEALEEGVTTYRGNVIGQKDAYRMGEELEGEALTAKLMSGVYEAAGMGAALGGVMGTPTAAVDIGSSVVGNRKPKDTEVNIGGATFDPTTGGVNPDGSSWFRDKTPEQRTKALALVQANAEYVDTQQMMTAWNYALEGLSSEQAQVLVDAIAVDPNIPSLPPAQQAELNTFLETVSGKDINTSPFVLAGKTAAQAAFEGDTSVNVDPITADAIKLKNGSSQGISNIPLAQAAKEVLTLVESNTTDNVAVRYRKFSQALNSILNTPLGKSLSKADRDSLLVWANQNLNASRERMGRDEYIRYQEMTQGVNAPPARLATRKQGPGVSTYADGSNSTTINTTPASSDPTITASTSSGTELVPATGREVVPFGETNETSETTEQVAAEITQNVAGTDSTTNPESPGNNPASSPASERTAQSPATRIGNGTSSDTQETTSPERNRQVQGDATPAETPNRAITGEGANAAAPETGRRNRLSDIRSEEAATGSGSLGTETTERNQDGQRQTTSAQGVDDVIVPEYVATPLEDYIGYPVRYKGEAGTIIRKPGRIGLYFLPYSDAVPEQHLYGSATNKNTLELQGIEPIPYKQINSTRNALGNIAINETPVEEVRRVLNNSPSVSEPVDVDNLTEDEIFTKVDELLLLASELLGEADARELMYDIIDILGTDATNEEVIAYYESTLEQIEERKRNEDSPSGASTGGGTGSGYLGTETASRQTQEANEKAILNVSAAEMDEVLGLLSFAEFFALSEQYEAAGYPSDNFEQWLREEMGQPGTTGIIGDMKEYLLAERGDIGIEVNPTNYETNAARRRRELRTRTPDPATTESAPVVEEETVAQVEEDIATEDAPTERRRELRVPREEQEQVFGDGQVRVEEVIAPNYTPPSTELSVPGSRELRANEERSTAVTTTENNQTRENEVGPTEEREVGQERGLVESDNLNVYTVDEYLEILNRNGAEAATETAMAELAPAERAVINEALGEGETLSNLVALAIFDKVSDALRSAIEHLLRILKAIPKAIAVVSVAVAASTASTNAQGNVNIDTASQGDTYSVSGVSEETNVTNNYIQSRNDNQGKPYIIADKKSGELSIFDADGTLRTTTPALFGEEVGDYRSGDAKVTPAGKFDMTYQEYDGAGYGGSIQSFDKQVITRNGKKVRINLAVHRVYTQNASEKRIDRLNSKTVSDNRVSYGCINVPTDFYNQYFEGDFNGYIYVLPETERYTGNRFGNDIPSGTNQAAVSQPASEEVNTGTRGSVYSNSSNGAEEAATNPEATEATSTNEKQARSLPPTREQETVAEVARSPYLEVNADAINKPVNIDGATPKVAVAQPVKVTGTNPDLRVAKVEPVTDATGTVVSTEMMVDKNVPLPSDLTTEPVFNDEAPKARVDGMGVSDVAMQIFFGMGLGGGIMRGARRLAARRRLRRLRAKQSAARNQETGSSTDNTPRRSELRAPSTDFVLVDSDTDTETVTETTDTSRTDRTPKRIETTPRRKALRAPSTDFVLEAEETNVGGRRRELRAPREDFVLVGSPTDTGDIEAAATPKRLNAPETGTEGMTFTPYTGGPFSIRPGEAPQPFVVNPPTEEDAEIFRETAEVQQSFQAAWFDFMKTTGELGEVALDQLTIDMANNFISGVYLDSSKRFSETVGRNGKGNLWRGIMGKWTEGITFAYLRAAGGATPRTDNHLIRNNAPRYGIEPDSTVFGTALAGARAKAAQAFEVMQTRYIVPIENFLKDTAATTDRSVAEVQEDIGNYATLTHLLDNGYEVHFAQMREDLATLEERQAALKATINSFPKGTDNKETRHLKSLLETTNRNVNDAKKLLEDTIAVHTGTRERTEDDRLLGGRTIPEAREEMAALKAKYDQATLDAGLKLVLDGTAGVRNYSTAMGGIDLETAQAYNSSGLKNYVPLYATQENIEASRSDSQTEEDSDMTTWEKMLNEMPASDIRTLGLKRDPSKLRRKGARNKSDHAINNLTKMAYIQSDLIAQAPIKTSIQQMFEANVNDLGRNADPAALEEAYEALNEGVGGNSAMPGLVRFRKGDTNSRRFRSKKFKPILAKGRNKEGQEVEFEYFFTNPDIQNEVYNNMPATQKKDFKGVAEIRSITRGMSRLMTQFRPMWNVYAYPKEMIERGVNLTFRNLVDSNGNAISNKDVVAEYSKQNLAVGKKSKEIYDYLVNRTVETPLQQKLAFAQASGAIQLYTDVLDKTQSRENRQESLFARAGKAASEKTGEALRGNKAGEAVLSGAQKGSDLYMKGLVEVPQVVSALSMYMALENVGVTPKEAANRTRDMFDPARGPQWQSEMSAFFPFIRSAMAGNYTTMRSLSQNGWKGAAGFALLTTAMGLLVALAGSMFGDDDDGVPKIASLSSLRGIPVPVGEDGAYYIPVGFGLPGMALSLGFSGYKAMHGKAGTGEVLADITTAITTNTAPVQMADADILKDNIVAWSIISATPELLQPAVEVSFNRRAFGGGNIYYGTNIDDKRKSEQGSFRTPEVYKDMAKSLANVTTAADMRPESLQFLIENYLGYGPLRAIPNSLRDADERTAGLDVSNPEQSGILGALTGYDIGLDRNALDIVRQSYPLQEKSDELSLKYNITYTDPDRVVSPYEESAAESYERRLDEKGVPLNEALFMANTQEYKKELRGLRKEYKAAAEAFNEARKLGVDATAEEVTMALALEDMNEATRKYVEENNDYF